MSRVRSGLFLILRKNVRNRGPWPEFGAWSLEASLVSTICDCGLWHGEWKGERWRVEAGAGVRLNQSLAKAQPKATKIIRVEN
jgi:hypothetical protein